jgi:hypothetical protein
VEALARRGVPGTALVFTGLVLEAMVLKACELYAPGPTAWLGAWGDFLDGDETYRDPLMTPSEKRGDWQKNDMAADWEWLGCKVLRAFVECKGRWG